MTSREFFDAVQPWFPLLGPMLAAMVAILGWFISYRLSAIKDHATNRRDIRISFLTEAYRRLEGAAERHDSDSHRAMESAFADIQLYGNARQVQLVQTMLRDFAARGSLEINPLLEMIRDELRVEIGADSLQNKSIQVIRFQEKEPAQQGEP